MTIPIQSVPPNERTTYIIDQLEGEKVGIPGIKGVFRILASPKQTNGGIAVFTSGAVLSNAPGFHWHQEAQDVFRVTKGYLKLWNGDKCRIMGPRDFAYVPPPFATQKFRVRIQRSLALLPPGDWVDFRVIDHCLCVQEGLLRVKLKSNGQAWTEVREGHTVVISAGDTFMLDWGSRYVRVWSFTNGQGIEEIVQRAGKEFAGFVLPDAVQEWDEYKARCNWQLSDWMYIYQI